MGGFIVGVIIFIAVSLFLMVWTDDVAERREERKKIKSEYDGPEFKVKNGNLYFDLDRLEMYFQRENMDTRIPVGAILKIEALERFNTESKNGSPITRALIGSLIAGGAGAVVGAASSSKGNTSIYIRKLAYRLYCRDKDQSISMYEINIAEGSSDQRNVRMYYAKFDEIGDILRDNFGLTIQHVD